MRSGLAVSGSCIGFSLYLEESLLEGILLPPTHSSFRLSPHLRKLPLIFLGWLWFSLAGQLWLHGTALQSVTQADLELLFANLLAVFPVP